MKATPVIVMMMSIAFVSIRCTGKQLNYAYVSPNKLYLVTFYEKPLTKHWIFPNHYEFYIQLKHGEREVIKSTLFYKPNMFDRRSFTQKFPVVRWLSDNVIRIGNKEVLPQPGNDTFTIQNNTNMVIKYLHAYGQRSEQIFIFDLQPHSVNNLYPQSQAENGSDLSFVWIHALFENGKSVSNGVNFNKKHSGMKERVKYCIKISAKEVNIVSSQLEGWKATIPLPKTLEEASSIYHSEINKISIPVSIECQNAN